LFAAEYGLDIQITIVPANISQAKQLTPRNLRRRLKPMHHQGRVGDRRCEVNKLSWTVHRRIAGKSPTRGEGFGQSRPVVLMSVLAGTETDVVVLGHAISHAGISRRTSTGLSSRRP
jgi:hypothetical protein